MKPADGSQFTLKAVSQDMLDIQFSVLNPQSQNQYDSFQTHSNSLQLNNKPSTIQEAETYLEESKSVRYSAVGSVTQAQMRGSSGRPTGNNPRLGQRAPSAAELLDQ